MPSCLNQQRDNMGEYFVKRAIPVRAVPVSTDTIVQTLEGPLKAKAGDYIITGVRGEQYPIDKGIFEETYVVAHGAYRGVNGKVSIYKDGDFVETEVD